MFTRWVTDCGVNRVVVLSIILWGLALPPASDAHDIPADMQQAAERFLKSLDPTQSQAVLIPFDSDRRRAWHYIPSSMMDAQGGRRGLEMKRMMPQQRLLALGLLNTALSHRGHFQALTIMALESILRDIENGNPARDPEMYHVAVYGQPSPDKTWGWSIEGHHLSVNLMLIDGQRFSVTPSFWGSNPAVVKAGPFQGLDTLATEQRLARELVRSLSAEQRKLAVIAATAPREIVTAADPKVEKGEFEPAQGIRFEQLDSQQQRMLLDLVQQFAAKYRQGIVDQIAERTPVLDGQAMTFAWAGAVEPGEGHYYRIQTPHFLFEYDNTQNDANHIHTVWRSFDGDFGEDLLRKHYETSPHHQPGK